MHELSFAEQILESVERQAAPYPGARVSRVRLRAPEALALEPASLRFALEAISVGTVMEGAQIELEEAGPEIECPGCGVVPVPFASDPRCPHCGYVSTGGPFTALIIEEIEIYDEDHQD